MSQFNKAEQTAESQGELTEIRNARLAYLKKNARLLFLHAKAKKELKINTMDVLKQRGLKSRAGDEYHQYRSNISPDYIHIPRQTSQTVSEDVY